MLSETTCPIYIYSNFPILGICSTPAMFIRNANGEHEYYCSDKCTKIGHSYIKPIQVSRGHTTRHAFKKNDIKQV